MAANNRGSLSNTSVGWSFSTKANPQDSINSAIAATLDSILHPRVARQSQTQYNGTDSTQLQTLTQRVDNLENCCAMQQSSIFNLQSSINEELKLDVSPNPYMNSCTVITTGKGKLILTNLQGDQLRSYSVSGDSKLELNGDVLGGYSGTFFVTLVGEKEKLKKMVTFVK